MKETQPTSGARVGQHRDHYRALQPEPEPVERSHRLGTAGRRAQHLLAAFVLLLPLSQTACSARLPAPVSLTSDDWGRYPVQPPTRPVTRLAFVFGNDDDAQLDATVRALAARGALVARVDPDRFAVGVLDRREHCLDLAGIVNWHADQLGRRFALANLSPPLLVGHGTGAGLIYALLAQAPPLTFAAGIGNTPTARLALGKPLCGVSLPTPDRLPLPPAQLGAPWYIVGDTQGAPLLGATNAGNTNGQVRRLPSETLARAATDVLDALDAAARPQAEALGDLPLVELPAPRPTDTLAIIYTGDGGWRDIDKTIGGLLARQGMAVVGVDSVRYFWRRRSAQQTANDLARILDHYRAAWGSGRVVLVGYSFGADVLPFAYNRLPVDRQQRVATVALLAPARGANFEVSIGGWLGHASNTTTPTLPALQRIPPEKILCVYGASEATESLCTAPGLGAITRLERPGDHHFDRRYDLIANAIRAHFAAGKP